MMDKLESIESHMIAASTAEEPKNDKAKMMTFFSGTSKEKSSKRKSETVSTTSIVQSTIASIVVYIKPRAATDKGGQHYCDIDKA